MKPPAYEKQNKFEVPPLGEDWLWWHPDEPEVFLYGYYRDFSCGRCQVRWSIDFDHNTKYVRCFCCGRFVRKPKI